MDFHHSEERQMLADTLTRFVAQDYPLADRLAAGASETGYDPAKWAALAELGVIGALFGEEAGGFGGAGFDISVVFDAIGRGLMLEPFLQTLLVGSVLANAGSAEQQTRLEGLLSGETIAAFAHFEAGDGCKTAYIATTAKRDGEGWVLNGQKAVVRAATASAFLIVSARTRGQAGDADGVSLFLVPNDANGVMLRDYETIDGGRAADVTLSNVKLGAEALIGIDGRAALVIDDALGKGLLALCAEAVGIMDVIKDMTILYIQTRKQFGVPIGKFQALQHRMADMLLEVEQARSAVINAAFHEGTPGLERERALSACKVTIGRVGTLVAEESIQIHGGMGMTWEYPLGHFAKRLTIIGHEMGDEDFHLVRYMDLAKGAGA